MKCALVDYGAGNVSSVQQACWRAGTEAVAVSDPEKLLEAERIIFPGVGGAPVAMERIRALGLDEAIKTAVNRKGRPFLGICLGMQLLGQAHEEHGGCSGINLLTGKIVSLEKLGGGFRIPHIGWKDIGILENKAEQNLLLKIPARRRTFYFAHSFYFQAECGDIIGDCEIAPGIRIPAALQRRNILATQFHPEKSQEAGRLLFQEFLKWNPA